MSGCVTRGMDDCNSTEHRDFISISYGLVNLCCWWIFKHLKDGFASLISIAYLNILGAELVPKLIRGFQQIGFTPTAAYEAEDLMTVAGFVAAGLGVSILPKTNGLMLNGLVWLPIKDEGSCCDIGLVMKRGGYLTPAAKRFSDNVQVTVSDRS